MKLLILFYLFIYWFIYFVKLADTENSYSDCQIVTDEMIKISSEFYAI